MKLGLLADIHGNNLALSVVLTAARKAGCERLLIAGDFVGYYYHPDKVFELLQDWSFDAVRGNHEEMMLEAMQDPNSLEEYSNKYGSALKQALEKLGKSEIDYITSLEVSKELEVDEISFLLCHGSPLAVDQYVFPDVDSETLKVCNTMNPQVMVLGHTHYPMLKEIGGKMIINPGSVGQPRDRVPGACWATFDTETLVVEFHREAYDNTTLLQEVTVHDPGIPYLTEVLTRQ